MDHQDDLSLVDSNKPKGKWPRFIPNLAACQNKGKVITEETIRVRYGETDQMGHAYYANYLFWFEQARGAWCRERGFTYKSMEEEGFFLPVVEAHLRYKGEILYDQEILVKLWVSEVKRASLKFCYEIRRVGEDRLLTEGYTWHVVMGKARKAISIPDRLRDLCQADLDQNAHPADGLA